MRFILFFLPKAEIVYEKLGLTQIVRCLSMNDAEIPPSTAVFLHNLIMSICDLENRRKIRKPINVPFNFGTNFFLKTKNDFFVLSKMFRSIGN